MGAEMAMAELALGIAVPLEVAHAPHLAHRRRLVDVVEQRRRAGEALVADELFRVERTVALPKDRVPLVGHVTELMVDGHL